MRFFSVLKPGIIFGNVITLCGGYFLGTSFPIHFWNLLATIVGMSLVIGSSCVFNNYIDRDIDSLMERTKNRVLVTGVLDLKSALLYGIVLGLASFALLIATTNVLTVIAALVGFIVYVGIYSLLLKRRSSYAALIGGIAGAVPPVVGYTAATNRFDSGAIVVFFILFFWQMPHFYAISIYRLQDYTKAGIPVLPFKMGLGYTKRVMLLYIALFTLAAVAPTLLHYTGWVYFVVALALSLIWFYLCVHGFWVKDNNIWARKMFLYSVIMIMLLCFMMAVKKLLFH